MRAKPVSSCNRGQRTAFTLIELLVVIAIIAVLMGLAFPAFQSVQNSAKRTQAKNDLTQVVTAVNAFYTEYGKYPIPAASQGQGPDFTYSSDGGPTNPNSELMLILQGDPSKSAENPRAIVFFSGPVAKSPGGYGIQPAGGANPSVFLDPWKNAYSVRIDSDYDGRVGERDTGKPPVVQGVVGWSLGRKADWNESGIASWK